jgi:hypothetical protein
MLFLLISLQLGAAAFTAGANTSASEEVERLFYKGAATGETPAISEDSIEGTLRINRAATSRRIRVPGFISSAKLQDFAEIVGPTRGPTSYQFGDTIYIRWIGTPGPREGEVFDVYEPMVVAQNLSDPTEFIIRPEPRGEESRIPGGYRMAGFFYETLGTIRITNIREGLAEAVVTGLAGNIGVGFRLMKQLPMLPRVDPIVGGIQLSGVVVSGSPAGRLSTTIRSFIYLNRGARDGIRVGRVFQSVDTLSLSSSVSGRNPEISNGEAMVVQVSDSYSTAIITRQFDVIRMGSILKTKQDFSDIRDKIPGVNLFPVSQRLRQNSRSAKEKEATPEVPNLDDMQRNRDPSLPELDRIPVRPEQDLSDLDRLERDMKLDDLSEKEKDRLNRLARQRKLDQPVEDEDSQEGGTAGIPAVDSSFGPKKKKPDEKKAKQRNRDEEELNLLMMEN